MIRLIIYACLLAAFVFAGATVKLGKYTFFEHVRAIWHTEQVQDLKTGVQEKAKPAVEKLKRGGEAAYNAMKNAGSSNDGDAGTASEGSDAGAEAVDAGAHSGSGAGSASRSNRRR